MSRFDVCLQAILPVLIGPARPAAEGGGFKAFPFHKLAELSDEPSRHTLHPTPFTIHPTPYTLHPTPYALHPTPYTLHSTPYSLHPAPDTLHPAP